MANVIDNKQFMNDLEIAQDAPVTEALMEKIGANINALLDDHSSPTIFTANGTFTTGLMTDRVLVKMCGGGGGGGGGAGAFTSQPAGGGGGGSAAPIVAAILSVSRNTGYSVTVGTGGAGGSGGAGGFDGTNGSDGTESSFGTLLFAPGGQLGVRGLYTDASGGQGGGSNTSLATSFTRRGLLLPYGGLAGRGYTVYGSITGAAGSGSIFASGGTGGTGGVGGGTYGGGGGGGGAAFSAGGNGGQGGTTVGNGTAGSSGSGGGGGGGGNNSAGGNGGAGGNGRVEVYPI